MLDRRKGAARPCLRNRRDGSDRLWGTGPAEGHPAARGPGAVGPVGGRCGNLRGHRPRTSHHPDLLRRGGRSADEHGDPDAASSRARRSRLSMVRGVDPGGTAADRHPRRLRAAHASAARGVPEGATITTFGLADRRRRDRRAGHPGGRPPRRRAGARPRHVVSRASHRRRGAAGTSVVAPRHGVERAACRPPAWRCAATCRGTRRSR